MLFAEGLGLALLLFGPRIDTEKLPLPLGSSSHIFSVEFGNVRTSGGGAEALLDDDLPRAALLAAAFP